MKIWPRARERINQPVLPSEENETKYSFAEMNRLLDREERPFDFLTLKDFDFNNKTVLCFSDLNSPVEAGDIIPTDKIRKEALR